MIASTADRVSQNTCETVNARIRSQTDENVAFYASGGLVAIEQRLQELDREWDVERYVETMAPTFSLMGLALGVTVNRKWMLVPLVIQSFFLQHALQGWCPPIPVLRSLGIRTADEINEERYALKALRGDFRRLTEGNSLTGATGSAEAMRAVRK